MITACPTFCKSPKLLHVLAAVALIFGVASIFSGGQVLFGSEETRLAAGNYVPFVVWSNFFAGFFYIAGAAGLALRRSWITPLAFSIAVMTSAVFIAFGVHILMGEAYEVRTIGAMSLRSLVWLSIAFTVRGKVD